VGYLLPIVPVATEGFDRKLVEALSRMGLLRTAQLLNPVASISLAITGLPLVALGSLAAQESIGPPIT